MINGHISKLKEYKGLNAHLDEAIDYLTSNDLEVLPVGLTKIGDYITITKLVYVGKNPGEAFPEEHREHLDMQIVLKNKEACYYDYLEEIDQTAVKTPYNPDKDVIKFDYPLRHHLIMDTNNFTLFTPDDVHLPSQRLNDDEIVKLVIKVKI